jgi:periplasmic protein TonB
MSKPSPNDRIAVTMTLSCLLNAILLFGITFAAPPEDPIDASSMEVILVQTRSEKAPEKADYLAQASQEGGGDSDKKTRPSDLFSSPVPKVEEGIAPKPVVASAPEIETRSQNTPQVLTQAQSARRITAQQEVREQLTDAKERSEETIERDMEMARLNAEIAATQQAYAKRPKRKFISANTQEYAYASYMQSWVARVERVGNLNYPEQARSENLQGSLVLSVGLYRDGRVEKITLIQSSGNPVLDAAAKRIVELAGPYTELPAVEGENFDILHITRTWQFLPGNVLSSQ